MNDYAIGCAGWSIPRRHQTLFGEGDNVLERYATRFGVTEINSSFYRSHRQATYARWAATVPVDFRFSVKFPKLISHELALRGAGQALAQFLDEVAGLEKRLGGFLLQMPPSLRLDVRAASTFFRMFQRRSNALLVCEPRHASWFSANADALFTGHGISRVMADPPVVGSCQTDWPGTAWPYWRLHGTPRMYYSDYADAALRRLATVLKRHTHAAVKPWVIFDNTALGFAIPNAANLQNIVQEES